MANNSGDKIEWRQIDQEIKDGWYIVKLDGSKFKPLRMPNITLETLKKYYDIIQTVALEVMNKFTFFHCCYIIDDEFHFLFHTNNLGESIRRVSKVVVKPATYTAALVNGKIVQEEIVSNKAIEYGRLCYDGRLIKLNKKEIIPYFDDIINHGKMFIGNIIVGDGKYFVGFTMDEIKKKAKEMKFDLTEEHMTLLGRFVQDSDNVLCINNYLIDEYKAKVFKKLKRYKGVTNPFKLQS